MRTCILITQTTTTFGPASGIDLILRRLGYELRLIDRLTRPVYDEQDVLLVDTRNVTKEFYARLAEYVGRRRPSLVVAIVDRDQRIGHHLALLEAGVDVILPWDVADLETQLAMALDELLG